MDEEIFSDLRKILKGGGSKQHILGDGSNIKKNKFATMVFKHLDH